MDWNKVVGCNLRRLRQARGLTQEALAGDAGLAMRHIGRIERGQSSPTATMLGKLAETLGADPADFFKRDPS
jgi:transcriptional regulator with XRE-family HTH domain